MLKDFSNYFEILDGRNDFPDLESMINFVSVAINKTDQLSALKSKIGLRNLKNKISQVKFENNFLIFENEKISIKNGKIYLNKMEMQKLI